MTKAETSKQKIDFKLVLLSHLAAAAAAAAESQDGRENKIR